ncbi:MAG: lytic transglycosylase domain-containing protein [Acetobacter sp.]|uniref:lytic transglycosylase domain-containing protein n=1 Tax=Acetobacter sp. TaxID=440 RepID=UPI003F91A317
MADDLQRRVDQAFRDASKAHNIDEKWLRAVAETESGGRLDAQSPAGAIGLMQIMPDTAKSLGIDPRDPVQAIHGAARLLDENLKRYSNPTDAMRAYNGGTDRARWDNNETRAYPGKVMANMAKIEKKQGAANPSDALDDSIYGWDDVPQQKAQNAPLDDSIYGWGPEKPVAHVPEQSALGKAGTLVNDTVNAAGREIDKTFGAGVPHLLGWLASAGHHYDNAASRKLASIGDAVEAAENADEDSRKGDYGSDVSGAVGGMLGAGLSAAVGGRLVRPAAGMLEGTRGGRVAANLLKGEGPAVTRWGNNALAAGVQTALADGDWKDQAALTLGLSALGHGAGKALSAGGGRLKGTADKIINYLDPDGVMQRAPEAPESALSAAAQKAEQKAQTKTVSKIGAFSDPKKAAQAIEQAFTSKNGTRLYEAQVPGVFHTKATRNGDVKLAGLEDNLRDLYPEAFRTLDLANGEAYTKHLRDTIGTPEHIANLEQERSAFEAAQREAAFQNEAPVSTTALHDVLDQHIADNRGNSAVKQALIRAKTELADASDDTGTALPSNLWNVRKAIGYGLQQAAASESSHMRAAASRLTPFMDDLAHHIEQGAPGFNDYLKGYSSRSSDIDSLRFLQSRGLLQASNDAASGEAVKYTALKNLISQIDKNEVSVSTKGTDVVTPEQEQRLRMLYRDMLAEREIQAAGRSSNASKTFKAGMKQREKEIRGGNVGAVVSTAGGLLGMHEGGAITGGLAGAGLHTVNHLANHALANRRLTNMQRADQEVINLLMPRR